MLEFLFFLNTLSAEMNMHSLSSSCANTYWPVSVYSNRQATVGRLLNCRYSGKYFCAKYSSGKCRRKNHRKRGKGGRDVGAVAGGEDLGEGDRPSPSEAVDNGLGEGSTYGENRWLLGFPPVSDGDLGESGKEEVKKGEEVGEEVAGLDERWRAAARRAGL